MRGRKRRFTNYSVIFEGVPFEAIEPLLRAVADGCGAGEYHAHIVRSDWSAREEKVANAA